MQPRTSPPRTAGATVSSYAPGDAAASGDFQPGDFILTHGSTFASRLIRVGQHVRFCGRNRRYAWWSHAAVIASQDGQLIEAVGHGVRRTHISIYQPTEYTLVRLGALASNDDRAQVVRFAEWCLGQRYGWLTVFSIGLSLLTGAKLTFWYDGQSVCSGLVARALERTSAIFDRSPSHILPADLAKYFDVPAPKPGSSRGRAPTRAELQRSSEGAAGPGPASERR